MPVTPPTSSRPASPSIKHPEDIPQPDSSNLTAAGRTDSRIATDRRSTGQMPSLRMRAEALRLAGLHHLSPVQQGQLSLMNRTFYEVLNPGAKKALKESLESELDALYFLESLQILSVQPVEYMELMSDSSEYLLNTAAKLLPGDQVEVLEAFIKIIDEKPYVGCIDIESEGWGSDDNESSDEADYLTSLKKETCMKMLAEAAIKIENDNPMQLKALKFLTRCQGRVAFVEGRLQNSSRFASPWGRDNLQARFDFAERAILNLQARSDSAQHAISRGELSFVKVLKHTSAELSFIEGLECINGLRASFLIDKKKLKDEGVEENTDEVLDQRTNKLIDLIADQVAKNPLTTLDYALTGDDKIYINKRLFIQLAVKVMEKIQTKKEGIEGIKIITKILEAYAKLVEIDDDATDSNFSNVPGDKNLGSDALTGVDDKALDFDKKFRDLFIDVELTSNRENTSQAQAVEQGDDVLRYIAAVQPQWFPPAERLPKLKQILELLHDLAGRKNLSINACLNLLNYDESNVLEKFKKTDEYLSIACSNEGVEILKNIETKAKENIIIRLNELNKKSTLEDQDVESLATLFKALPKSFSADEQKALRGQLFDLVFKVANQHPQLGQLVGEVVISGRSDLERHAKGDDLTRMVERAMASKTTSFDGGIRLLVNLKKQLEQSKLQDSNSKFEQMMTAHLARQDFEELCVSVSDHKSDFFPYKKEINEAAERTNSARDAKSQFIRQEVLEKILQKYNFEKSGEDTLLGNKLPRLSKDDVDALQASWYEDSDNYSYLLNKKPQVLQLLTKGALPPDQFIEITCNLAEKMNYQELSSLVQAADEMEKENATDITGWKILPASISKMIYFLLGAVQQQGSDDAGGAENKDRLMAQVSSIEERHIARLRGEKRANSAQDHANEAPLEPLQKRPRLE
jgi:hypothetical protein